MQTPFFLIRQDLLKENVLSFQRALDKLWPNSRIGYSVKTNSLPYILQTLHSWRVMAEVVSDEEYELAKMSGFSDQEIVFNGPIKSIERLEDSINRGAIVNFDSQREIDWLAQTGKMISGRIGFRVNLDPDIYAPGDVGYQQDGFRFGYSEETGDLAKAFNVYENAFGRRNFGLHLHVNTITRSVEAYRRTAEYAVKLIRKYSLLPLFIDIGGGFFGGVPGKATPEDYISAVKEVFEEVVDIHKTTLILEPGSAFVGSAIEFHTTVVDVKDTLHGRIITTDGSRIHIDPLWQKKGYMYYLADSSGKPLSNRDISERQVVCGYTCMDHDRIMVIENGPKLISGDQIVYQRVGNYTMTLGGPFIRPFPDVYEERDGKMTLVRKKMTMEEYYKMESV